MRRFVITYANGAAHDVDADKVTCDERLAAFFIGDDIVGLAQGWDAIVSEEITSTLRETAQRVADMTGMRTVVDPAAPPNSGWMISPDAVVIQGPDGTIITGDDVVQAMVDGGAVVAEPQTSEDRPPGVSTDPNPGPVGDVDANPPENPSEESTGDDDPPASDGNSADHQALKLQIGRLWGSLRGKPVLTQYATWAESENIPVVLGEMTSDHLRRSIEWFEERKDQW